MTSTTNTTTTSDTTTAVLTLAVRRRVLQRMWKQRLCKGDHFDEDCCKCLPRLPVGCVDVKDACKKAFGGFGVCKNFVKDDMSAIDFERGSKKHLCNVDKPDCCECFSLKKTKTTKP